MAHLLKKLKTFRNIYENALSRFFENKTLEDKKALEGIFFQSKFKFGTNKQRLVVHIPLRSWSYKRKKIYPIVR